MNLKVTKTANHQIEKRPQTIDQAPGEFVEISKPIDFRTLLQLLFEKWLTILTVSVMAAGVGAAFVFCVPEKYQAKAVLQVEQEEPRVLGTESVTAQDLRSPEALNTIVQTVKNSSVLRRVVRTNNLALDPMFLLNSTAKNPSEPRMIGALGRMITVKLRPETRLIDIAVLHGNPEMAQKLANSVAQEFVRENLYGRFNTSKAANGLLYEEAARLKAKLENSEQELQAYKQATQTVSIEDRQNVLVEKLKELSKRYTDAQSQRLALEAELAQLNATTTNPAAILAIPSVQADPAVVEMRKKLLEEEANVVALSAQYQPTFPRLLQAKEQVRQLEQIIQSFAEKVRFSVESSHAAAVAREKNIESALKGAEAESLAVDKKGVGYNVRLRELQSDRALYDSVLKRLKETDLSKGLGQASLTLVEPASTAVQQDLPAMLIIGGCFFLGFSITLGMFYLLRRAKGSIHTVDDAEHLLGLPVWAAIPSSSNEMVKGLPHIMAEEPGSICAESFRTLRTSASVNAPNNEKKILLFTSADPGEGKTFCSLNYAICQAQEGKRTLLIDLDLRKPSIGGNFNLRSETPGVTD
ncbi:MAG: Capsular exopolysaccharide family, partial [Verrucomicrobiales bacterium]|nr:Capsular exopolysaccharide family [Verrucomicrobiales bacterium]